MAKTIDINMDTIKEFFSSIPDKLKELLDKLTELWENILANFEGITLYQQIAWGVLALGLILFILAFIV